MADTLSRLTSAARIISKVTNPCIFSVLVLVLIAITESGSFNISICWIAIIIFLLILLPLFYVYIRTYQSTRAVKLLADPTGKKMGKSEGNVVNLDETPENMYGKVMSWPDGVIGIGFELCTKLPMSKVNELQKQLKSDKVNPRDLKMRLAYEITSINHGEIKSILDGIKNHANINTDVVENLKFTKLLQWVKFFKF